MLLTDDEVGEFAKRVLARLGHHKITLRSLDRAHQYALLAGWVNEFNDPICNDTDGRLFIMPLRGKSKTIGEVAKAAMRIVNSEAANHG